MGRSMLMPALWGGLSIGILSALPIVGALNLCCCMWVVAGGMLAAYVLQANSAEPITLGDGAVVGLLAGILGAFVHAAVSLPLGLLLGPVQQRAITRILESAREMPPEVQEMLTNIGSRGFTAVALLVGLIAMLFVGAVFATTGGVLGAVFFRKKAAPSGAEVPPETPHIV